MTQMLDFESLKALKYKCRFAGEEYQTCQASHIQAVGFGCNQVVKNINCQCLVAVYLWYHRIVLYKPMMHQKESNQSNSKVENASGHRRGQPDGLNGLDKGLMTQTRSDIDDEGTNLTPCNVSLQLDVQDHKHKKQHKPGT